MRTLRPVLLLAALLFAAAGPVRAEVTGFVNAVTETRAVAGPVEREIKALLAERPGPFWMAYAVPTTRAQSMCCWSSGRDEDGCGGCRLEEDGPGQGFRTSRSTTVPLGANQSLRVLLRGERGRITRMRALSDDCTIDAGGRTVVWLEGVGAADSVAYLAGYVGTELGSGEDGRGNADVALMAIAHTADKSADAALDRFLETGRPLELRKKAAFWLAVARRPGAVARLSQLVTDDPDQRFREHVVFALSQTKDPVAVQKIIDVAKRDPDGHVRGQALFWLAQTASRQAAGVIEAAAIQDPEVEVKKKAVFALSQLPKDEGVPLLMKLARDHRSVEVRKQAMFWLGQSGDPRALAFFEDVLKP